MHKVIYLTVLGAGLSVLAGCSALTTTTDTAADAVHTVSHGLSVSSRSSTDATRGDSRSARAARARVYVDSEMPQLRREAAAGGGEHIDALAELIDSRQPNRLGAWMQAHYRSLFDEPRTPTQFVQAIQNRRG